MVETVTITSDHKTKTMRVDVILSEEELAGQLVKEQARGFFDAKKSCPVECLRPNVRTGGVHNGGIPLVGGVCREWSSRPFDGVRYCGSEPAVGAAGDPDAYTKGGVDCRRCRGDEYRKAKHALQKNAIVKLSGDKASRVTTAPTRKTRLKGGAESNNVSDQNNSSVASSSSSASDIDLLFDGGRSSAFEIDDSADEATATNKTLHFLSLPNECGCPHGVPATGPPFCLAHNGVGCLSCHSGFQRDVVSYACNPLYVLVENGRCAGGRRLEKLFPGKIVDLEPVDTAEECKKAGKQLGGIPEQGSPQGDWEVDQWPKTWLWWIWKTIQGERRIRRAMHARKQGRAGGNRPGNNSKRHARSSHRHHGHRHPGHRPHGHRHPGHRPHGHRHPGHRPHGHRHPGHRHPGHRHHDHRHPHHSQTHLCPQVCKSPNVTAGGKWNGGLPLENGVCTHWSSRSFQHNATYAMRYCGPKNVSEGNNSTSYTAGDAVDCRSCRGSSGVGGNTTNKSLLQPSSSGWQHDEQVVIATKDSSPKKPKNETRSSNATIKTGPQALTSRPKAASFLDVAGPISTGAKHRSLSSTHRGSRPPPRKATRAALLRPLRRLERLLLPVVSSLGGSPQKLLSLLRPFLPNDQTHLPLDSIDFLPTNGPIALSSPTKHCPKACLAPFVRPGGKHNGGLGLHPGGVCLHFASKKFLHGIANSGIAAFPVGKGGSAGVRYCGPEHAIPNGTEGADAYRVSGGIDCTRCRDELVVDDATLQKAGGNFTVFFGRPKGCGTSSGPTGRRFLHFNWVQRAVRQSRLGGAMTSILQKATAGKKIICRIREVKAVRRDACACPHGVGLV